MATTDIQTATAADREALIQILLLSFATDPCTRYTMATPKAFIDGFPGFSMGMGERGFTEAWSNGQGSATPHPPPLMLRRG